MGGGRSPVRTRGGGGIEAMTIGCTATIRGGVTGWIGGGGGRRVVKLANTHEAHFRLSIGEGFWARGFPSAS